MSKVEKFEWWLSQLLAYGAFAAWFSAIWIDAYRGEIIWTGILAFLMAMLVYPRKKSLPPSDHKGQ